MAWPIRLLLLTLTALPLALAADPVLTLNPGTLIYQKGDAPLVIDRQMAVADADNPASFDTGTLTVGITANGDQSDVLSIAEGDHDTQLVRVEIVGQTIRIRPITISGATRTYGDQVTIASWTGGSTNSALVIVWNREATLDRVVAVMQSISFSSSNLINPPTDPRNITVAFSDGSGASNAASADTVIRVVNYNTPPVTSNGTASATEDADLSGSLAALWQDDDSGAAAVTYFASGTPVGGTLISLNQNTGAYVFRPTANFNGAASFQFYVRDERSQSNTSTVAIAVAAVNDTPSWTKGANVTVDEDCGQISMAGWATAISAGPSDEAGQTLTFTITANTNPSLFEIAPAIDPATGTLTFKPAANANGSASITAVLADNGGGANESASQSFSITVRPVNDPPTVANLTINSVEAIRWTGTIAVVDDDTTDFTFMVTGISRLGELTVDEFTGAVTFDPQRAGSEDIPFTVSDGTSTITATLSIRISDRGPDRPRITSHPAVEVVTEGDTFQYDVIVDPQSVPNSGILAARLEGITGATLSKVSGNRFRISLPIGTGTAGYKRFGIVVTDTVNNASDYQAIVLTVVGTTGGSG